MSFFLRIPLFYILTAIAALAATSEPDDAFAAGIEAYQKSQYKTAKTQFTAAVEADETAAARHNLGLAQFQLNAPAEAVWQMERAQLLSPFNADYRFKLEAVRQELGLFAGAPKWYVLASQALPTKTWLIIASISAWLLIAALILPLLGGSKAGIRIKSLRSLTIAALLLSLTVHPLSASLGLLVFGLATGPALVFTAGAGAILLRRWSGLGRTLTGPILIALGAIVLWRGGFGRPHTDSSAGHGSCCDTELSTDHLSDVR